MKQSGQQLFQGADVLHKDKTNHISTNITDPVPASPTSPATTESADIAFSPQQPPIRIKVQKEVELVPLTWDEVSSTTLSPDTCSKCWAEKVKDEKLSDAAASS